MLLNNLSSTCIIYSFFHCKILIMASILPESNDNETNPGPKKPPALNVFS